MCNSNGLFTSKAKAFGHNYDFVFAFDGNPKRLASFYGNCHAAYKNRSRYRHVISYVGESSSRLNIRTLNLHKILFQSDKHCLGNCRMHRRAFF